MLRDPDREAAGFTLQADVPIVAMSVYAESQYRALALADSITVDPHKAGYVPYPAGALCYRNSRSRDLISLASPVIYQSRAEPTVGIYGVEGSKPGAAAAAIWLSHRVIGADRHGYGKILGECLWTSKRLYSRLATLHHRRFRLVPFEMLPAEREGLPPEKIEAERRWLRETVVETTNQGLLARIGNDSAFAKMFRDLGSDQVIVAFALNALDKEGKPNLSLTCANTFNQAVFERCSMTVPTADLSKVGLFLTSSTFDPAIYGQEFVDA